jgi:uncharacterized protein (TIGR02118 family)
MAKIVSLYNPPADAAAFDAYFDSLADLQAAAASAEGQAAVADTAKFASGGVTFLIFEERTA